MKRKVFSAEERLLKIQEFKESGLSCRGYCKGQGIAVSTFSKWLQKQEGKESTEGKRSEGKLLRLLPVEIKEHEPKGMRLLSPSGWELKLPVEVDTLWLSRLLVELS